MGGGHQERGVSGIWHGLRDVYFRNGIRCLRGGHAFFLEKPARTSYLGSSTRGAANTTRLIEWTKCGFPHGTPGKVSGTPQTPPGLHNLPVPRQNPPSI